MYIKKGQNYNAGKKEIIIPMLKEKGQNPNVLKIRSENQSV